MPSELLLRTHIPHVCDVTACRSVGIFSVEITTDSVM